MLLGRSSITRAASTTTGAAYGSRWRSTGRTRPRRSCASTRRRWPRRRCCMRTTTSVVWSTTPSATGSPRHRLVALNGGSRAAPSWRIPRRSWLDGFTQPLSVVRNPSHFVDYQDCKYLGRVPDHRHPLALCAGITQYGTFQLGGVALLDTQTLRPVWEVPITTLSPAGNVITRNPIDVDVVDGKLRLYLAPDDDATTVFTYEAEL